MSLVGPRPIVTSEIEYYQQGFALYKRVRPGLTGMWQVSGRTNVTYDERVRLDEYYVRNWSLWLDIYIIVRTVWVVLQGKGAY
jgi:lipopolysaccharide/colanic/teichoic acid biosynthesis glycosyltransferase